MISSKDKTILLVVYLDLKRVEEADTKILTELAALVLSLFVVVDSNPKKGNIPHRVEVANLST